MTREASEFEAYEVRWTDETDHTAIYRGRFSAYYASALAHELFVKGMTDVRWGPLITLKRKDPDAPTP